MRFIGLGSLVKPCLVKYFKLFAKSNQRAKGQQRVHFVYRPDHKGHTGELTWQIKGVH